MNNLDLPALYMENITGKPTSLYKAVATAVVQVSSEATIGAIQNGILSKVNWLECSRAAGLLAIKNTSNMVPGCPKGPVEFATVSCSITGLQINVSVEVHAINRSSVATQAMHGATITALTLFHLLQPVDHKIEICSIKLSAQSGGTPAVAVLPPDIRCAVVVCSNSIAAGTKQDGAGTVIRDGLNAQGIRVAAYTIIPDDVKAIQAKARSLASDGFQLVIFCGGTGMLQSDVTPQALAPLIDRPLPGIMQAARAYGQERTPFAMLSRGIAGFINTTLVLTLPGSTRGAEETMVALFPYVLHVFNEEIEGSGSRFLI